MKEKFPRLGIRLSSKEKSPRSKPLDLEEIGGSTNSGDANETASKARPFDFAESEPESINVANESSRAWKLVEDLKERVYESGKAPSDIPDQWSKIRDLNDKIQETLEAYEIASVKGRFELGDEYRKQISELESEAREGVLSALHESPISNSPEWTLEKDRDELISSTVPTGTLVEERLKSAIEELTKLTEPGAAESGPKEEKESVLRAVELAKRADLHEEREKKQELETKYLVQYKKFHASHNVLTKHISSKERKELESAEKAYNEANLAYAQKMCDSVSDRLFSDRRMKMRDDKYAKLKESGALPKDKKGKPISIVEFERSERLKLSERYNGLVRYREVIKPAIEAKQQARLESQSKSGKSAFGKMLGGYQKANQWLEGKVGSVVGEKNARTVTRAVRLLITTGIVTGATMTFGGVALAGAAGFAGTRLFRGAISTFGGAAMAGATGKLYQFGRTKNLEVMTETLNRSGIRSIKDLKRQQRIHGQNTKENIESERRMFETAVALLTGMGLTIGTAEALAQHEVVQQATHTAHGLDHHPVHPPQHAAPHQPQHAPEHAAAHEQPPVTTHPTPSPAATTAVHPAASAITPPHKVVHTAPAHPAAPATPHTGGAEHATGVSAEHVPPAKPEGKIMQSVKIEKSGEGMDGLFASLKHQIAAGHLPPDKMTPLMKHIAESHPSALSHEIHAALGEKLGGTSATTHMGDQLVVDEKGNVWFEQVGKEPHLVMESAPEAPHGFAVHQLDEHMVHMQANPAHHAEAPAHHASATATPVPEDPSVKLNQEQAAIGHKLNEATALHDVAATSHEAATASDTGIASSHAETANEAATTSPAEAVQPHATPEASPVPTDVPPSVSHLTSGESWNRFSNYEAGSVFFAPADPGTQEAIFRTNLFSVLRESGVGPDEGESITKYVARATAAIHEHTEKGIPNFDTHPALYQTSDGHLRMHGGEVDAQLVLAQEYLAQVDSHAQIIIENPGGKTPVFVFSEQAMKTNYFPPAEGKLAGVVSSNKKIF